MYNVVSGHTIELTNDDPILTLKDNNMWTYFLGHPVENLRALLQKTSCLLGQKK